MIRDDDPAGSTTTSSTGRPATRRRPRAVFARADVVVVEQEMLFPRSHPAPMETCGAVADFDRVDGKLTRLVHDAGAARAPHAVLADHRAAGAPIRVISPDVGGGFGNKVPVYPGYVCAIAAARHARAARSSGWRTARENLMSTGFARDFAMKGRIAATRDGQAARRSAST